MSFIELRAKTNFTFLTGASHPEELVLTAIEKGLAGIALTDANGVYGMPRGYKIAKDHPHFKYLCGAEVTFTDHTPLTILAQTKSGYGQLCRLLTLSRGSEKNQTTLNFERFKEHTSKDWIVLPQITRPQTQLSQLKEIFGSNIYLPITFYQDGKDKERIQEIIKLSKIYDITTVASNDVEYHEKRRKIIQDVLISIREGKPLEEVGFKLQPNGERYVKSMSEMKILYKEMPEALSRTLAIGEQCTFSPSELRYYYPSEWIPKGHTAQTYLEDLVWKCTPERYGNGMSEQVRKQLLSELKLIRELNFADYFLTIYDIVEFAKSKGILCQGRGSAANSAVCYVLGITAIDPIQMDLLFERFLSAERGEPPDIDIDFEHERREEVIQYIYSKYGRDRAAMVSAVVTYQYRNALRDVSKAFGVAVGTLSAKKVEENFDDLTKDLPNSQNVKTMIYSVAKELQGFPRHLSIHSGGFTLSAYPIIEIVPVEPARMEGRTIIQWDKYDLDTLGLIKVDVLSLGILSCLKKALQLAKIPSLADIPPDDQPTYEMIGRCETVGTFQIESRAQMSMLGRLQPRNFYDLVIEIAIVRPGPIVGNMVHPYLKRRRGLEKVEYPNETVKRILGRTLGIPLFQEQVMKLAIELADFTPGEADLLRKSINAWRSSGPISLIADRLMKGLRKNGMSQKFAEQIFDQIQGFSNYGFPESHSASFALLAYASCYLKKHFPAEYACALVNSQPMGFYRPDTIFYEALRNGVKILPVSIFKSQWDCTMEGEKTVRLGFRLVKGISEDHVKTLIEEREKQNFQHLSDFIKRSSLSKLVLERLALAGRFEDMNWSPRDALWALLEYQNLFYEDSSAQLSLFKDTDFYENLPEQERFGAFNQFEKIQMDYQAFSATTHGHPMAELRKTIRQIPKTNSVMMKKQAHGTFVTVSGLILFRQKPPTAKGVCFATMEDEFGFMDLVLWPDVFEKHQNAFLHHCFVTVKGVVQKDANTVSLLVKNVKPIWNSPGMEETPLSIKPHQYFY